MEFIVVIVYRNLIILLYVLFCIFSCLGQRSRSGVNYSTSLKQGVRDQLRSTQIPSMKDCPLQCMPYFIGSPMVQKYYKSLIRT
jgi:hypothetical protein